MIHADFTKEQYQKLMNFMKKDEETTNSIPNTSFGSAFMVGSYCFFTRKYVGWIIDSGASDLTCHDLSLFASHALISDKDQYITIRNGTEVIVKCKRVIKLKNGIILHDVLYMPNFYYHLFSTKIV